MFSERIISQAPWSVSKMGCIEKCGLQYHKKYIEHRKESRSGSESKVGVAVHSVLERAIIDPNASISVLADQAIEKEKLTTEEADVCRGQMASVEKFIQWLRWFRGQFGVRETMVERQMAITRYFQETPFYTPKEWTPEELRAAIYDGKAPIIRGVIDLGLHTEANDLIIIDHKTGKHKDIGEHAAQLNVYRLFAAAHLPVRNIQCCIHYVQTGRMDWTPPMPRATVETTTRKWLALYLNSQHHRLSVIQEKAAPPAETGWWCGYCGFINECLDGQEALQQREAAKLAKQEAKRLKDDSESP